MQSLTARKAAPFSALVELGLERAAPFRPACQSTRVDARTHQVFTVRPAMGTLVSVTALDPSPSRGEDAIESAFSELERLVAILSRHDPSSALSALNDAGRLEDTPPELAHVVGRALHYHRLTAGAFDITVKPLVDLIGAARGQPSPSEWSEAAQRVGAEHVELSIGRVRFRRPGMGMTLDGIAKGYIVDRMAEALFARDVRRFLVNAGGDIRAAGGKGGGEPWSIGVRDPARPGEIFGLVRLTDGAVATSGNYLKEYRHIVSKEPPRSPEWNCSVSVVARHALAADALATALFAMEPAAGFRLAQSIPGCEYLVVDRQGRSARSPGFSRTSAKACGA